MRKSLFTAAAMFAVLFVSRQATAQSHEIIEKEGIKIHVITSKPDIFEVTSVLLEGRRELILVDAQFSTEDAERVADLIKATRKELTAIFISYSDPDFYFGLYHILQQFPQAKVYSTAQTAYLIQATKEEKRAIWSPRLGKNAPEQIVVPTVHPDRYFLLEGKRIEIKQIPNDEQHAFLWIPTARVLLGGICLTAGEHLWVADAQTKEERAKWRAGLDVMEQLHPDYSIPAHFAAGKSDLKGDAPIRFTKQYLTDLEKTLDRSTNSGEVIQQMKALYPELGGLSNLEMTAKVLKGEIPWKTVNAFPAIGRKAEMNFGGDYVFELHFKDEQNMTYIGTKGSLKGSVDSVRYMAVEVAPRVYMVYWTEPGTNTHVVHVEDFGSGTAYTNISAPDGSFINLKGTLKLLDLHGF